MTKPYVEIEDKLFDGSWFICFFSADLTGSGRIINFDTGLDIIAIDAETDSLPIIFNRICFHQNTVRHQIVSIKNRSDTV